MKKLLFAAVALLSLAACNEDLGPEYTTLPVVSNVTFQPSSVTDSDAVVVKATATCEYGLSFMWIVYMLNDDPSTMAQTKYKPCGDGKTETSYDYSGTIPKQPAGTKVSFQVTAASSHSVQAGSTIYSYTVTESISPLPDPEE